MTTHIREVRIDDQSAVMSQQEVDSWANTRLYSNADNVNPPPVYSSIADGWPSGVQAGGWAQFVRACMTFRTQNMPADAVIGAAKIFGFSVGIRISGSSTPPVANHHFYIVQGNHQLPPIVSDFGAMLSQSTSSIKASYHYFYGSATIPLILDATGIGFITKGDYTKFGLRSLYDISGVAPTDQVMWGWVITVYWTLPSAHTTCTATKLGVTNLANVSAQLNGTANGYLDVASLEMAYTSATEAEDAPRPRYRFQYKKGTDPYTSTTWQYNVSRGNNFSQVLSGLSPNTMYTWRIQAESDDGTVWSSATSQFTTATYPTNEHIRVGSLVHRVSPGDYNLEMILGGLTSQYSLPVLLKRPIPALPGEEPVTPTPAPTPVPTDPYSIYTQYAFVVWLSQHVESQIAAFFGHSKPAGGWDYNEWVYLMYSGTGGGGLYGPAY